MSRDETPDATGLREAVAQHLHERFAAEHEPHWRELDESEQADSIYTDMARSLFEPGAPLAAHPTPDASPEVPRCTACRMTDQQCMEADAGCCDVCRATGGCSHTSEQDYTPAASNAGDVEVGMWRRTREWLEQWTGSEWKPVFRVPHPDPTPEPSPYICRHGKTRAEHWCDDHDDHAVATPDASPDPAVVQALADVIAEHREDGSYPDTCLCEVEANPQAAPGHFSRHLAAIVANHVAATREADRAEVERLRALADMYLEEHDKQHARAEAAEERLAGLVAQLEALADEWETAHGNPPVDPSHISVRHAQRLRALIPADAATALDAVREGAKAEAGVLAEVAAERVAQDAKWGQQNHPDGTGPQNIWPGLFRKPMSTSAAIAKTQVDFEARTGRSTYAGIFLEEVFEALAESDPVRLRAELIQVAAVAVAWVEKVDRDGARIARHTPEVTS